VAGPLDVLGSSDGGVMHEDLRHAALQALQLSRERARARAMQFDWRPVCEQFVGHLVPVGSSRGDAVTKSSQKLHKLGT